MKQFNILLESRFLFSCLLSDVFFTCMKKYTKGDWFQEGRFSWSGIRITVFFVVGINEMFAETICDRQTCRIDQVMQLSWKYSSFQFDRLLNTCHSFQLLDQLNTLNSDCNWSSSDRCFQDQEVRLKSFMTHVTFFQGIVPPYPVWKSSRRYVKSLWAFR